MALPPTALTALLYDAPTPDAMYDALDNAKCLSTEAQAKRSEVVALLAGVIERTDAQYAARPGFTGPSSVDQIARALVDSPYLSARGRKMSSSGDRADAPTTKSWWEFWK